MMLHTDQRHSCDMCGYKSRFLTNVRKHKKNAHRNLPGEKGGEREDLPTVERNDVPSLEQGNSSVEDEDWSVEREDMSVEGEGFSYEDLSGQHDYETVEDEMSTN